MTNFINPEASVIEQEGIQFPEGVVHVKEYSEEAVEACNKLTRRYREHLSRKNSFSLNIRDVFVG